MEARTKTLTVNEIRSLNIGKDDVMSYDFQYENGIDNHYLCINGARILSFINPADRRKTYNKIQRMNLGWGWQRSQLTDEEQGIIQAACNGENPFAYSIICANPALNECVR
jgi:hypothetical protein